MSLARGMAKSDDTAKKQVYKEFNAATGQTFNKVTGFTTVTIQMLGMF